METWKPVVGFEGRYEVSDAGMVRSLKSASSRLTGRTLCPNLVGAGYHALSLGDGTSAVIRRYIHRLVAESFLGACPPNHEVNHKNGIKIDNRAANLEYVTKSQNQRHASTVLRKRCGENGSSKLTELAVRFIRDNIDSMSQSKMAALVGVSQTNIGMIVRRKTWTHI